MPRRASNASVSEIEVEIDRPADRAGKNDKVRSDSNSQSVSGSGASNVTAVSNSSSGNWFLEQVTAHAVGNSTYGNLQIVVRIVDGSGTTKAEQVGDVNSEYIPFNGNVVKPGWSVEYDINQDDANSYTVLVRPLFRKPEPSESGTESNASSTTETVVDNFEDSGLSEYTEDTGDFTVQNSTVYNGSQALQGDNTGGPAQIVSTSGLPAYFAKGEKADVYVRTTAVGTTDTLRGAFLFGASDSNNCYLIDPKFDLDNDFGLDVISSGTPTELDLDYVSNNYKPDTWYRIRVVWDDGTLGGSDNDITATIYESGDSTPLASVTANDSTHSSNDGIGFEARTAATGENVFWDYVNKVA